MSVAAERVAVLHLGRHQALGEQARVASWGRLLTAAGFEPVPIGLRTEHPIRRRPPAAPQLLVPAITVPEALAWDARGVRARLAEIQPTAVVHVTLRCFHPALAGPWTTVLDFVDRLSRSYADRALEVGPGRAGLLRLLGWAHRRAESRSRSVATTAAGHRDAIELGTAWIPNVIELGPAPSEAPTHDVVFFGNLAYPPNRLALHRLASIWPEMERLRPGTSTLVGGRHADATIAALCQRLGWTLAGEFADPVRFAARGRIAVAPMTHAAGIQNKIIEAAAADRPQVISPAAASGVDQPPPGLVANLDSSFALAMAEVLDDVDRFAGGRRWVDEHLSPQVWADVTRRLVTGGP